MQNIIELFKQHVIDQTKNHKFIHHEWYYDHHLKIVEQLTNELCRIYIESNSDIVQTMVRLHDYDKICSISKEERDDVYTNILKDFNFEKEFITQIIEYI